MGASKNKIGELLQDACTPNLYRENPFRLAWLRADAANREIARHADKLKMQIELGHAEAIPEQSLFTLDPAPGPQEIREAVNRLKDPQGRIIHEFFWFWPLKIGRSESDEALAAFASGDDEGARVLWRKWEREGGERGAIGAHNMAVYYHMLVLDLSAEDLARRERDEDLEERIRYTWERAFKRWESIIEDDGVWDRLRERIGVIDDPALRTVACRHIRNGLPEALDKINAELALAYARQDRLDASQWRMDFIKRTHQALNDVGNTIDQVLRPTRQEIEFLFKETEAKCGEGFLGIPDAIGNLLTKAEPLVERIDMLRGKRTAGRDDLCVEIFLLCYSNSLFYYHESESQPPLISVIITKKALRLFDEIVRFARHLAFSEQVVEEITECNRIVTSHRQREERQRKLHQLDQLRRRRKWEQEQLESKGRERVVKSTEDLEWIQEQKERQELQKMREIRAKKAYKWIAGVVLIFVLLGQYWAILPGAIIALWYENSTFK